MARIAVIGWGSLIWDSVPEYDDLHGPWFDDGPLLPLEFSRVSRKRPGALTLVVDPVDGTVCRARHAQSTRTEPMEAVQDLAAREQAPLLAIGLHLRDGSPTGRPPAPPSIQAFAEEKGYDAVVWTGLDANFESATGRPFSVGAALDHLHGLPVEQRRPALVYIDRAPALVSTPLRSAVAADLALVAEIRTAAQPGM